MSNIIEIIDGVPRQPQYRLSAPITFAMAHGEQLAIVGGNGSGKTVVMGVITGAHPLQGEGVRYNFEGRASQRVSDNIKYIAFRDSYGDADGSYYYQQRWNSFDRDDQPIVKDVLPEGSNEELREMLFSLFGIEEMLHKEMILLSSGELRKLQLTRALLSDPPILILENPFIGLDANSRLQFQELLAKVTQRTSLQVILVLSKSDDIPQFVTHIVPMQEGVCGAKISREEYLQCRPADAKRVLSAEKEQRILSLPSKPLHNDSRRVVEFNSVSIRYGERTILRDLTWCINRGERWALSGENGSGKSTLLSLVCADNPQSYACDITLFGRRRGTGESIWDIKRHIGYVSPEMHRAYNLSIPSIEIVASGLHDTVGLFKKMKEEQREVCEFWMDIFGIADLKDRSFMQVSSGEQRLILLARAFVKDPELLILDEPLHGLDMRNRRLALDVIETFCLREGKSLILVTHYKEELPDSITNSLFLTKNQ
ncbi:MAG: ATP-binding cassette domain-containing protein [Rikenellaceae bacterium]